MEEFKENETSKIFGFLFIIVFLGSIILPLLFVPLLNLSGFNIDNIFIITPFILCLLPSLILNLISKSFSVKEKYTTNFLNYIDVEIFKCKTINDLIKVRNKIYFYAVDKNNMIKLKSPLTIKEKLRDIDSKIEILKKQ